VSVRGVLPAREELVEPVKLGALEVRKYRLDVTFVELFASR